ncbi:formate--tetrahydrofolate ligase [candidate division WOR-1 bacterium RIFCSPLOWO2_02_FULL_46_20]|uniref:Formate--tetrahydrofolate ligase n=2 Tax=Saganbacteria TaxID=1703751 RepID=A0A1F4R8L4_UNCSA|nr:MAG: formate--tetrahydrofolate ligase [candidate division WOR-1 bacterium RIFCSPHIGHO2_02_FULL_45_12]OGC04511.1 MAG: formate--tetrahydrofolate ligase [candidate division WOR-1 bacterium RIFCSPLOWO2_02_FULL_46_20]OGC09346.1 MAG: formate--tetrahydrofolate ligase [candidate division WOR-1 bacterium RIFCSPLOWO2_12_FULL_45_9]
MLTDIEIAQRSKIKNITDIADKAGIKTSEIDLHGCYKAKISLNVLKRLAGKKDGKLILVTTMTPTPRGEGKTTITIGLGQALKKLGKKTFICIREPSLGPVMGLKGGAAGGGYSQVIPMDDINLHLTGDMHMITSAHNLLTAMLYNHIHHGNYLNIDEDRLAWHRVMDMNDRSLRGMFAITASSEVMAILCLAKSVTDMKQRLGQIVIAYNKKGQPVRAREIKAEGAMTLLLWHALKPNLVQTLEGGPAFVHGGPFANIAHGCNSLIATRMALKLSDYVVTEAGFGSDLGAEKFFNIKCRVGELKPSAVVLVVTKQAVDRHGYANVARHVANLNKFGVPIVIAVNKKLDDSDHEIGEILDQCQAMGVRCFVSEVWARGGEGGKALAGEVIKLCAHDSKFQFLYDLGVSIREKIEIVAREIYGADEVIFTREAERDLEVLQQTGCSRLSICVAKTQYSLSDDKNAFGKPEGFKLTVRELKPSAGAGFVVVYTGAILTMPGLPEHPAAENMDISEDGKIVGLF